MKVRGRRLLCVNLIVFLLVGMLMVPGMAFAETSWFTCKVELAGPGKNYSSIALTDQSETPVFTGKWFTLPADKAREMLAVALVAINSNKQVVVVVDPEAGTYPEISDIYLLAGK